MNKLSGVLLINRSRIRKWTNWLLYAIFGAYILFLIVTTPHPITKLVYGLIGFIV